MTGLAMDVILGVSLGVAVGALIFALVRSWERAVDQDDQEILLILQKAGLADQASRLRTSKSSVRAVAVGEERALMGEEGDHGR